MTYAHGMGPLPRLLDEAAGQKSVARAFASADLPLALVENRDHRIPLVALADLFEIAARLAGERCFGLRVGAAMTPADYGGWVEWSASAGTLGAALARMEECIAWHQPGARMALAPRAVGRVAWAYAPPLPAHVRDAQHADHVLLPMIGFLRGFLGSDWMPDGVEVPYVDPDHRALLENALPVPWRFGCPAVAIVFPHALLARPAAAARPRDRPAAVPCSFDWKAEAIRRAAEPTITRVEAIVALRLMDQRTDLDGAAQLAGMSRRTLQREIGAIGESYRDLLERVRMARARALLAESDATVTEVALAVGYSETAHFTRAFRRRFGHPPSAFRRGPGDADRGRRTPRPRDRTD